MNQKIIRLPQIDPGIVSKEIEDFIIDQMVKFKKTGGVIGLSGGVDSTVTAALSKRAFDKYNSGSTLKLIGLIMPSGTNHQSDQDDGVYVAKQLGIEYEILNIENIVKEFQNTNPHAFQKAYHKGNMMSRIRAAILHTKASTEEKLVIGTGNWDEDFALGYYTLFGDGAVHLSPIGSLPKRLVRQMAVYLGFEKFAQREPTAGLEEGQTDFKDLGYYYDLAELVCLGIQQGFDQGELFENEQINSLAEQQIEIYKQTFGDKKFKNTREMIEDVLKRKEIAVLKGDLICPPVAEVSLKFD